jgi:hypothetical protein
VGAAFGSAGAWRRRWHTVGVGLWALKRGVTIRWHLLHSERRHDLALKTLSGKLILARDFLRSWKNR